MRSRTTKSVIILVMMVLITSMSVITADMTPNSQDSIISGERGNSIQQQSTMRISEDTLNGILNPLEVEQQGYITSGNLISIH
jgi:hypothetical protein